jgi:hypothetical protein
LPRRLLTSGNIGSSSTSRRPGQRLKHDPEKLQTFRQDHATNK